MAKPLYDMVASATKQKIKSLPWTPDGHIALKKQKALVNNCPKLYFIDYNLPAVLYSDASNYSHGAYLCQIRELPDGTSIDESIRFVGGTFQGPQVPWSTIEKEAYAIYWALLKLDDLVVGGFTSRYVRTTATYFS